MSNPFFLEGRSLVLLVGVLLSGSCFGLREGLREEEEGKGGSGGGGWEGAGEGGGSWGGEGLDEKLLLAGLTFSGTSLFSSDSKFICKDSLKNVKK